MVNYPGGPAPRRSRQRADVRAGAIRRRLSRHRSRVLRRPRQLEYDFVVAPGADPDQIALPIDGAERVEVDAGGDLVVHTAAGELRQPRPVVYQEIDGIRRPVVGDYVLDDQGRVRFRLGAYDASRALVIDPVLAYSTYLGGSDDGKRLAVRGGRRHRGRRGRQHLRDRHDDARSTFRPRPAPPARSAATRTSSSTKLLPTGAVLYSTYLGGRCDDIARAIAVDAAGNAYITGRANSAVCFMRLSNPGVLVAKLSPKGALVYSLVFGGSLVDTSAEPAIAVDPAGHAYVTGRHHLRLPDHARRISGPRPAPTCHIARLRRRIRREAERRRRLRSSISTFLCGDGTTFRPASRSTRRATCTSRARPARATSRPSTH